MQAQLPRMRGSAQPPPSPEPSVEVGAYRIVPSMLIVAPGERARVAVTLRADVTRLCREQLVLDVSERFVTA